MKYFVVWQGGGLAHPFPTRAAAISEARLVSVESRGETIAVVEKDGSHVREVSRIRDGRVVSGAGYTKRDPDAFTSAGRAYGRARKKAKAAYAKAKPHAERAYAKTKEAYAKAKPHAKAAYGTAKTHAARAHRKSKAALAAWRAQKDPGPRRDTKAKDRPWRVRDRLTRARYYFDTRGEALSFVEQVSTSDITGEPLRQWHDRLVVEKNK